MRAFALVFGLSALVAGCRCGPSAAACSSDRSCADDGRYCTAPPTCDLATGRCVHGGSPCSPDYRCDELAGCVPIGPQPDGGDGNSCEGPGHGEACASAICGEGVCNQRYQISLPSTDRALTVELFPGGYCAERCDPSRLNPECAPCERCADEVLAGGARLRLYAVNSDYGFSGVCRARCTPSENSTGCARAGYACDPETLTCLEACRDDAQCQLVATDDDGDGRFEILDRGPGYPARCDRVTGRCQLIGDPGARIGDPCSDDRQCPDNGVCVRPEPGAMGVCGRAGCIGIACEEPGTGCDVRNTTPGTSACLRSCEIGAEDGTAAMRGARTGGHPDCGLGQACAWNGLTERGDPNAGSCVIGAYNDRRTSTIGQPCSSSADCDSPFGYGECLFADVSGVPSGVCSVRHCATFLDGGQMRDGLLPGVAIEQPICDGQRGHVCVNLAARGEPPQTHCLVRCTSASECAPGYACSGISLGGSRFCRPFCNLDQDCAPAARCENLSGLPCVAGEECFCSSGGMR